MTDSETVFDIVVLRGLQPEVNERFEKGKLDFDVDALAMNKSSFCAILSETAIKYFN